jgi:hypothetical protein
MPRCRSPTSRTRPRNRPATTSQLAELYLGLNASRSPRGRVRPTRARLGRCHRPDTHQAAQTSRAGWRWGMASQAASSHLTQAGKTRRSLCTDGQQRAGSRPRPAAIPPIPEGSGRRPIAMPRQVIRRLCCIWSMGGMPKPLLAEGSDRQGELVERGGNSKACWLLDRELVVAAPKVLHQGMPSGSVALRRPEVG